MKVAIYVNGKLKLLRRGHNIARVTLRRLPRGRFKVRIVATQSTGGRVISTRTYRGCKKGPPHTRVEHHGRHG